MNKESYSDKGTILNVSLGIEKQKDKMLPLKYYRLNKTTVYHKNISNPYDSIYICEEENSKGRILLTMAEIHKEVRKKGALRFSDHWNFKNTNNNGGIYSKTYIYESIDDYRNRKELDVLNVDLDMNIFETSETGKKFVGGYLHKVEQKNKNLIFHYILIKKYQVQIEGTKKNITLSTFKENLQQVGFLTKGTFLSEEKILYWLLAIHKYHSFQNYTGFRKGGYHTNEHYLEYIKEVFKDAEYFRQRLIEWAVLEKLGALRKMEYYFIEGIKDDVVGVRYLYNEITEQLFLVGMYFQLPFKVDMKATFWDSSTKTIDKITIKDRLSKEIHKAYKLDISLSMVIETLYTELAETFDMTREEFKKDVKKQAQQMINNAKGTSILDDIIYIIGK